MGTSELFKSMPKWFQNWAEKSLMKVSKKIVKKVKSISYLAEAYGLTHEEWYKSFVKELNLKNNKR